jgi:transposase InsO family protein
MNDKDMQELALFKFSLIAPIVNNTYVAVSQMQYFRDIAAKLHILPNGKTVKYSSGTIKKWFLIYRKGGFDSLITKLRSDAGMPRVIDDKAITKIHDIKDKFPYITGKLVYQKLVEEGYIKATDTSMASIHRYIRDNNLKRNQISPVERKAYEMEYANDCWQSDTSHGPVIKVGGQKRQTYLITMLDDATRIIAHGEFFFNDNAVNMQIVFKKAILKYGLPKRLFVDNGPSYKNDQLRLICASLGVILIYAKAYSPQSKGKIERSFRTIKDNWINGVDWNEFDSLESLNSGFSKYLNEKYMNSIHSSLEFTPRERYLIDTDRIKTVKPEDLDNHFLHRVIRRVNNDATIQLYTNSFEVPQKYIGQKINIRYSPITLDKAYIFNKHNISTDIVYPLKKVDNSKIKRTALDYTMINGGGNSV